MRNVAARALALLVASAVPAMAGTITETISFSLGGFADVNGSPALPSPTNAVSGSFSVRFDPAYGLADDTTDLAVHAFRGTSVASAFGFSYFADVHYLLFGGLQNGADFARAGSDDFVALFDLTDPAHPAFVPCSVTGVYCGAQTGSPLYDAVGFTTAGTDSLWFVPVGEGSASVPEPQSAALLAAGVLGLFFRRRAAGFARGGPARGGSAESAPAGRAGW